MEEHVGQAELDQDDDPVERLHADEAPEVDVVLVVDVLAEEGDKGIPLLLLVLYEPGGGALAEELHEAALHDEPEHPWEVEEEGKEDQVEGDPLVVGVVHDGGPEHQTVETQRC